VSKDDVLPKTECSSNSSVLPPALGDLELSLPITSKGLSNELCSSGLLIMASDEKRRGLAATGAGAAGLDERRLCAIGQAARLNELELCPSKDVAIQGGGRTTGGILPWWVTEPAIFWDMSRSASKKDCEAGLNDDSADPDMDSAADMSIL